MAHSAATNASSPTAADLIRIQGSPSRATQAWEEFARDHAPWLAALPYADGPLDALPKTMIRRLHQLRPMERSAYEAELAFARLCRQSRAVGFADGRPIRYRFLSLRSPASSGAANHGSAPPAAGRGRVPPSPLGEGDDTAVRLKGFAGWLLTEPKFLQARASIKERWRALPEAARPRFPLRRGSVLPDPPDTPGPGSDPTSAATAGFSAAFVVFCDQWGLAGLTCWDFPNPLGPEFPNQLSPGSTAPAPPGVYLYVPLHFPLTGMDDILHLIQQHQRSLATKMGIDPSAVGLRNYKAYAQVFEIAHWERVIRGRHGRPGRTRGLVVPMVNVLAKELGIGRNQVIRLRKVISLCLCRKRNSVAAFRTRA